MLKVMYFSSMLQDYPVTKSKSKILALFKLCGTIKNIWIDKDEVIDLFTLTF